MKFFKSGLAALLVFSVSCNTNRERVTESVVEVQGHRGDRGNFPENSIPAFISAVKKGADVIELDVVISKDGKVVISHEPFMSSLYMLAPNADSIPKSIEKTFNLYTMTYDSIKKFDGGAKGNIYFPQQQKMKTYKPLLSEAVDSVESYIAANKLKPVKYNIEIKSDAAEYGKTQPQPEVFVNLVMDVIKNKRIAERINIQSFDPEPLNILKKKHPNIKIAFLTDKPGIDANLSQLEFTPEIYSPHYKLVNTAFRDSLKQKGMRLIPWTVNDEKDIDAMLKYKVDGIITDYPERVKVRVE